jgi:hypothetical protein
MNQVTLKQHSGIILIDDVAEPIWHQVANIWKGFVYRDSIIDLVEDEIKETKLRLRLGIKRGPR